MKHYLKKAIRLSNYLSLGGRHCLQISRTVLALSLYVIVSPSLCLSVRSNEWQSGDVVLIYCMVAQMEPGWNVSVIGASQHL